MLQETAVPVTRFIALAAVGNKEKKKVCVFCVFFVVVCFRSGMLKGNKVASVSFFGVFSGSFVQWCLFVCLFFLLTLFSICLSDSLSVALSLFVSVSVSLFLCLSVCLSLFSTLCWF